jgi:large subunit ribosomal protein L6
MFAPCRGKALRHAILSSPAVTLPRFLVPAWQTTTTKTTAQPRQFSSTPRCHSKLGRTPISIPPGVELTMGEPKIQRGARDWKSTIKRTITVKGPLGMHTFSGAAERG